MGQADFRAPFIPKEQIQAAAERFRQEHWSSGTVPVDIEAIVEFKLDMEIRPIPQLKTCCDIDALLLGNLSTIVVDWEMYMDDRMHNRVRYSIAHEVGHKVLHPDLYSRIGHTSINEWVRCFRAIPEDQYSWVEQHAYEFAGRLLVPPDTLRQELDKQLAVGAERGFVEWDRSGESAVDYLAHAIARTGRFEVSEQVIARRLRIEGLWPPKT